jgi:hypothetical protein
MVTNFNIMTNKIDVQLEDGIRIQIDLERELVAAAKDAV